MHLSGLLQSSVVFPGESLGQPHLEHRGDHEQRSESDDQERQLPTVYEPDDDSGSDGGEALEDHSETDSGCLENYLK